MRLLLIASVVSISQFMVLFVVAIYNRISDIMAQRNRRGN